MLETLFALIAITNMAFASWTTFYGPRWMLAVTAGSSLLAWLAIFLSAGRAAGWGLLVGVFWSAGLVAIGWLARDAEGWQRGLQKLTGRLHLPGRGR